MSELTRDLKEVLSKLANIKYLSPDFKVTVTLSYPHLEGVDESVLEDLIRNELVVRKVVDVVIACAKCGSLSISTKYACPACSSVNMIKSRLIQHVSCGYTDSEVKFPRKENGVLICPKCGAGISDERELKVYATFFECVLCHFKTSSPDIIHKCHNCGNIFKSADALLRPLYMYELSNKGRELLK
ncbi:MAG: hypothetical protein QW399_02015 [Sulfolobales archaeon]